MSRGPDERPRPARLYLDTSAYLCILLGEAGSDRLSRDTDGAELLSSVLLVLEAKRNLVSLARRGTLTPDRYKAAVDRVDEDTSRFVLRDLTLDLCRSMAALYLSGVNVPCLASLTRFRFASSTRSTLDSSSAPSVSRDSRSDPASPSRMHRYADVSR